jgi:hypothetical protein
VDLTEKEARAAGHKLKVGKVPIAWAIERDETAGLTKVVVDAASDLIDLTSRAYRSRRKRRRHQTVAGVFACRLR